MNKFEPNFPRYLAAKKSVDDRALNQVVWKQLAHELSITQTNQSISILEIGAGVGTMVERLLEWELLTQAQYTALDAMTENIRIAQERLPEWGVRHGYNCHHGEAGEITLTKEIQNIVVNHEAIDVFDFISETKPRHGYDLLVAHAFLDLMDIPATLPKLFQLLKTNGLFYFSINYDGMTILEPVLDAPFEELVFDYYHRTMDDRIIAGKPSGDSRSGRHLFKYVVDAGGEILEAGSSDWVVFPRKSGYQADEAYFLHMIINTIQNALQDIPAIDQTKFKAWIEKRHNQIEQNELVYVAHQFDLVGRVHT